MIAREDWAAPGPALIALTVVMSAVAFGASGYLTAAHYTSPDVLACSSSGTIDCAKVTTSAASRLVGVPVAVLGLAWSLPMLGMSLPAAWRNPSLAPLRLAWVVGGVGFVIYLIYAELFEVSAICLWCTVVHVAVFVLFTAVLAAGIPEIRR